MKASVNTQTGLIIESQADTADDAVLRSNAAALGIFDVEIRVVNDAEHEALIAARELALNPQGATLRQIDALERQNMIPRVTREALLAYAVFIAQSGGVPEAQLYAENIAYRKMKDFDAQIAALRAQL